jgi:multiple sugar transport system substrate-binding protein
MSFFDFQKYGDKRLFALALAVLASALFRSGWGSVIQAAAPVIVFAQWQEDDSENGLFKNLIEEFESKHRGIKVALKARPYEDLRSALFDPAESGEAQTFLGDILALDPLWILELTKRETIVRQRGEASRIPLLSFINVLYYNVEILKEAGFIRPPKTRSEFLAYARAVSSKDENRWGLAMGGDSSRGIYDDVYPWVWAAGAQLMRDGQPAVSSRPVTESLGFLASLASEGLIVPGALARTSADKLEDFVSGRAAFMLAPARDIRFARERMGEEAFGVSAVPLPDNHSLMPLYGSAGWAAGVHSDSASKEEAGLFAAFLTERASFLSEKAKAIPGTGGPAPPDPFYSKAWDIAIAGENARDFDGLAGTHELEEIFREELLALFAGQSTPAETAAAIQRRWTAIISGIIL